MDDLERRAPVQPGSIVLLAAALMIAGLVMIASARASIDRSLFSTSIWESIFGRQAVFVAVGMTALVGTRHFAPLVLASPALRFRVSLIAYLLVLTCLVVALIPGVGSPQRGSQRWLQVTAYHGGLGFQPSELAKLTLIAFLAALAANRGTATRSLRHGLLVPAAATGIYCVLVSKEDFGTGLLLAAVGACILLVAGYKFRHLLMLAAVGAGVFLVLLFAAPYRVARLSAYRDIWADQQGGGYQPLQSLTAIAQGGWFGTGLGAGIHKYGYLPEGHSDFIFALICEETGLVGAVLVMALFCGFIYMGARTMWAAQTQFEQILAFGITAAVTLQAAMNIAVVTVVLPTTGISLPFVSAGGSGLLVYSVAAGVLAAIASRGRAHILVSGRSGQSCAHDGGLGLVGQEVAAW